MRFAYAVHQVLTLTPGLSFPLSLYTPSVKALDGTQGKDHLMILSAHSYLLLANLPLLQRMKKITVAVHCLDSLAARYLIVNLVQPIKCLQAEIWKQR